MPHRKPSQRGIDMRQSTAVAKANQPFPIEQDEILDWDAALEVVPARPSGTVKVAHQQAPPSSVVADDPHYVAVHYDRQDVPFTCRLSVVFSCRWRRDSS